MSEFTKNLEIALAKESLQDRVFAAMVTLAVEYEAKTITTERFAQRVFEMLLDYAKSRDRIFNESAPQANPQGEK